MIKICIALLITCAAIFIGPYLADSQGYVHIATNNYIIEMSVFTGIIVSVIAFIIFYFVVSFILSVLHLPHGASLLLKKHIDKKQLTLQNNALIAFEEGDFKRALMLFEKAPNKEHIPTFTKFIAADAAFELGDYEKTRSILDEIEQKDRHAKIAVAIVRAKMNFKLGNVEAALETLQPLKLKDSSFVSKLSYQSLKRENDYEGLASMAQRLIEDKVIDKEEAERLYAASFEQKLSMLTKTNEALALRKLLPKQVRYLLPINTLLLKKLDDLNDSSALNKLACDLINHNKDEIELYKALADIKNPLPKVRKIVESRLEMHKAVDEAKSAMLKALAQLESNESLNDTACEHLLSAQQIINDQDVQRRLALIYSKMRLFEKANQYFVGICSK